MGTWTKEVVDLSVAGSSLTIDDIKIDGTNIGHTDDTDLLGFANGTLTVNGIIAATGNVTVGGNLTITGTLDVGETNITNVGSIALDTITNDGSDITLDSSGDIILDAAGSGDITLKDGGSTYAQLEQSAGNLRIKSSASNNLALTFIGADIWTSGDLTVNGDLGIADSSKFYIGTSSDNDYILATGSSISLYTNDSIRFSISDSLISHYAASAYTNTGAVLKDASGHARLSFTDAGDTVLYDESGNTTLTLDTSQNVTITGDLTITGGNITSATTFDSAVTLSSTINGATLGLDADSELKQSTGTGTSNTLFGKNTGDSIASGGNYNTLFGENAGTAITTGVSNLAIGYDALKTNIDGDFNIAIGEKALEDFEAASDGTGQNIAIGYNASKEMSTAIRSTFIGNQANGGGITTGTANTGLGYQAGYDLTSAAGCVLIGNKAGENVTEGNYNTCLGSESGRTVTTGEKNLFIGRAAGSDTTSSNNVILGDSAGFENSSGTGQTFIGYSAGYGDSGAATTGDHNTAIGFESGKLIQGAGTDNTYVGAYSGNLTTTGTENTALGFAAKPASGAATNQISIGNNITGTADNAVHIGNNTSHIRCDFNADQTWDASSDRRQKKDIETTDIGLDFINDLNPVKYKHKSPSEFPEEWTAYDAEDTTPMGGSDKYYYGFIAQEVKETVDKYNVGDYSAWGEDPDGRQRVSKEAMIVTLVKAVQELTARIEELETE